MKIVSLMNMYIVQLAQKKKNIYHEISYLESFERVSFPQNPEKKENRVKYKKYSCNEQFFISKSRNIMNNKQSDIKTLN